VHHHPRLSREAAPPWDPAVVQAVRADLGDVDRRLRRALNDFFTRRLSDPVEAEDMTQDVFCRLAIGARGEKSACDSYVFAIAANLLRDRARRERVRMNYCEARKLDAFLGIDLIDPFRVAAGRQDLSSLAGTVASLPDKTRAIFILNRVDGVDKHRLAERFGLTVRMIEIHIKRALVAIDTEQAVPV
jgi:RNA polymerase sigma-70 factor (ECF subfamily)